MEDSRSYEVIWAPDAALKLEEYVEMAKTTTDKVYDRSQSLLGFKPYKSGQEIVFEDFEHNGFLWVSVKNIILVYEIIEEEKIVAIEACYLLTLHVTLTYFTGWTQKKVGIESLDILKSR